MKKIKFLAAAICFCSSSFLSSNLFAQWSTSGGLNSSDLTTGGKVGIGVAAPAEILDINGVGNSFININRTPISAENPWGSLGIKLGSTGVFSISSFANYGTGTLNIINNGTSSQICITAFRVNFGSLVPASGYAGKYNFDDRVWAKEFVVSDYQSSGAPNQFNLPSGFRMGINGGSYLRGQVVIGTTVAPVIPTAAPTGGYGLVVAGNSNINGALVVGDPATITSTTPFNTNEYSLFVTKGILVEKAKVCLRNSSSWSDFVFNKDYNLRSLSEVESFIKRNKHLPDVPSAEEVVKSGIDIAEMKKLIKLDVDELISNYLERYIKLKILR